MRRTEWRVQAAGMAPWPDEDLSLARANRFGLARRRRSKADRARLEGEDVAARPALVPAVVEHLPCERVVTMRTDGGGASDPADSSVIRIVAAAA